MGADLAEEEPFGPYLVYERLGVGGMATVHRALERGIEGFERIVALKRLLPHLAEDASFIKSFVREAKLASFLNHVNIVQIFELGRVGSEYFISMEYIDGRDIRRVLRHARKVTGPPPIHVTVGLMLQLCEALDYAHAKSDDSGHPLGLVHRDVSPSNLLVTSAGHLKVIDFGIAKAQSQQLRTQTGRVKGKLAYMAPEAVSGGRDLDARSDLFAAGVILHELLTARPLFASKNEYQTLLKVQRGDISPPSAFNQACPAELDAICLRALARDPDDRFSSAADMRDELLALRRQLNLQTGHRDIAQWLTWAFSIEAPSNSFGGTQTHDVSQSFEARHMKRTPAPRREDDEAVEIAWGGGEEHGSAEPVLLDDVPDVSEKHLAVAAEPQPRRRLFEDEDDDDIPAPSHGHASRVRAAIHQDALDSIPELPVPPRRDTPPPVPPRRDSAGAIGTARVTGSHPAIPTRRQTPTSQTLVPTPVPGAPATIPPPVPRERRTTARGPGTPARPGTTGDLPSSDHADLDNMPPVENRPGPDTLDPEVATGPRVKPPTHPGDIVAARSSAHSLADLVPDVVAPAPSARHKRPSDVTIGQSIIERQSVKRTWVLLVGLGAAGAAATAITLVATRGDKVTAVDSGEASQVGAALPPDRLFGTVKFLIEPADAEIRLVESQLEHAGSPWTTQVPAGNHQIQIQRSGYKAWLTSIELSANETQTLRVVLEPLTSQEIASAEATLIVASTPDGLEAVLDGRLLGTRTPIKLQIKPGPHTILLRQNGSEVWRHDLVAQAAANYEFSPSMAEDKQRERKQRAAPVRRPEPIEPPAPPPHTPPDPALAIQPPAQPPVDKTVERPIVPGTPAPPNLTPSVTQTPVHPPAPIVPPDAAKPPAPTPPPRITTPTPPPPVAVARARGPVLVPPSAVTKLSGSSPSVGKTKRAEVPPVVAAKVCIDASGTVTTVDMITKLERLTSVDLGHALKTWRYAPYKSGGTAVPACFVVSFRVE